MRTITLSPTVGTKTGNVLELADGRLVVCQGSGCAIDTSDDGGENWTNRMGTVHPNAQPRSPFIDSNGNLYFSKGLAGGSARLYRSSDSGNTWQVVLDQITIDSQLYSNALWFIAEHSSGDLFINAYSFGNSPVIGWQARLLFKSVDNGLTWTKFYTHPNEIRHLHMVAIDSHDNIYLSGAHSIFEGQEDPSFNYILNADGTIETILSPANAGGGMCGMAEADNGGLFFASDRLDGVFRLENYTFTNVLDPTDWGLTADNYLTIVKGRFGVLYTISNAHEYLFASADNGVTWVHIAFPDTFTKARPGAITVGRGATPYIYWDGGYTANYRRLPDFTKEQLQGLYTSTLTIKCA